MNSAFVAYIRYEELFKQIEEGVILSTEAEAESLIAN